jgi:serine/threonine protein kinase
MTYGHDVVVCPKDGTHLISVAGDPAQIDKVPGFTLIEEIGLGNSGRVYKVNDASGQVLAIKILHQSLADNLEMVTRFKKEAELSSRLASEHTVAVRQFGLLNDGRPFMVMDYLDGICLGALVDRNGPMPFERALPIFVQIADGLAHAHELGIMHRDIKPYNVMLMDRPSRSQIFKETARIIDFGIAKRWNGDSSVDLTVTGEAVGTPVYMSPEQCLGAAVDHRTDIYSLGCVMFETLTGRLVFTADNPVSLMTKHVTELPPPLMLGDDECAISVERIVLKTLEKKPHDRYQSASELRDDLNAVLHQFFDSAGSV